MPHSRQDVEIIVKDTLTKIKGYATQTTERNCAITSAACVIYNLTTKDYVKSGGAMRVFTSKSGSDSSYFGPYRKLIQNHKKLCCVGDKYRSSDAELKILDQLMALSTWKKDNLVIIKISQKPCKACSYAISKFAYQDSEGVVAACWGSEMKLYGDIAKEAPTVAEENAGSTVTSSKA